MQEERYRQEAKIIGNYLLPEPPEEDQIKRYSDAMHTLSIRFSEKEQRIWNTLMKYPLLLAPVDAALALKEPEGNIRRKIFVMLAILEAGTAKTKYFLPKSYSLIDWILILLTGARAIVRLIFGMLILSLL